MVHLPPSLIFFIIFTRQIKNTLNQKFKTQIMFLKIQSSCLLLSKNHYFDAHFNLCFFLRHVFCSKSLNHSTPNIQAKVQQISPNSFSLFVLHQKIISFQFFYPNSSSSSIHQFHIQWRKKMMDVKKKYRDPLLILIPNCLLQ